MKPIKLADATRTLKAPRNWNNEDGECASLDIFDYEENNGNIMVSAWMPDKEELQALQNGAVLYLHIHGVVHPVVGISVQGI